jgi:hypothetical protein
MERENRAGLSSNRSEGPFKLPLSKGRMNNEIKTLSKLSLFPFSSDFTAGLVGLLRAKYQILMYISIKRNVGFPNKMPNIECRTYATLLLVRIM